MALAATLAGSRAEALHQGGVCEALGRGELGAEAFDAARRMGEDGWPWVEAPGADGGGARSQALRALWLGRHEELGAAVKRLGDADAARALEAAGRDARLGDDEWWSLFVGSWPASLGVGSLPSRVCSDWRALADRASRADVGESERAVRLLGPLTEEMDALGARFGSAWIESACARGAAIQRCALAISADQRGASRDCAMSLANAAGAFARSQAELDLACSWQSYWAAWRALAGPRGACVEMWEGWIRSYCEASVAQSVAARRSATPAALWEALEAHKLDAPAWSPRRARSAFERLARAGRAHLDAWAPTPGEPSAFHWASQGSKIRGAIESWAKELGDGGMQGALDARGWWPELAARAEALSMEKTLADKTRAPLPQIGKAQSGNVRL